jgi:hypothetical protein
MGECGSIGQRLCGLILLNNRAGLSQHNTRVFIHQSQAQSRVHLGVDSG